MTPYFLRESLVAAVVATGMAFARMSMMIAMDSRIIGKLSFGQCLCSCISIALYTAIQADSSLRQCILCTTADTATDQRIDVLILQQSCQSTMPGAIAAKDMRLHDFPIFQCIDFELLRLTKMLKDLAIVIGYC